MKKFASMVMRLSSDLQFKVDSERQIFFEKLFMVILFTPRVFTRSLLRGNRRRSRKFVFNFDVQPGTRTLGLRLISLQPPKFGNKEDESLEKENLCKNGNKNPIAVLTVGGDLK